LFIILVDENSISDLINKNKYSFFNCIITVIMGRGNNNNLMYGSPPRNDQISSDDLKYQNSLEKLNKYSPLISSNASVKAFDRIDKKYVFNYFHGENTIFAGEKFTPPDESYDFLSKYSGTETFFIRKNIIPDDYLTSDANKELVAAQDIKSFEFKGGLYELANRVKTLEDKSILKQESGFTSQEISLKHYADFDGSNKQNSQGELFQIEDPNSSLSSFVTLGELVAVEDIFGSQGKWIYSGAISYPGSAVYVIQGQPVAAISCGPYAEDYINE
jgi:hypothetical protein